MKHTKRFMNRKYHEYLRDVKKIGGVPLKQNAFNSAYEAYMEENRQARLRGERVVDPNKELVYASKYATRYKTAIAQKKELKAIGIKESLEDLKKMETTDFARKYAAELAKAYREQQALNPTASGKDIGRIISQMWFGSK